MLRRMLSCLIALAATGATAGGSLGISYVETANVRLFSFDTIRYLEPHALRTFTNSLEWQKRNLGWTPWEPTTVLLKDLADFGNAAAMSAPRNLLIFDVAPLSRAFETFPASERMYSLMNHELVHVAAGDVAAEQDRFWRRLFFGKVAARAENPETILWSYLTVPRFTAARWYNEGAAVFVETWMGGGLGRAQGGYDEMVFRAMVRDSARFYDPLALVTRGIRTDFQYGANAYLYGTRFFTWLAFAHGPEKVLSWLKRDESSKRYFSDQFEHVYGMPIERAWGEWIAFEREFQARNLAEVRKHPVTPQKTLVPRAVGSSSRLFLDERAGLLYGAFRYPGVVQHVGSIDLATGESRRLADIKGPILYRVSSLAHDRAGRTLFYTSDNLAWRDLMALDLATGEARMLLEDARIGEIAFNPVDRSLLGVRHENGIATLVRIPHPYETWEELYAFGYEDVPYDLDISPDGRLLSASMSEVSSEQFVRVWEIDRVRAGDMTPLSQFKFGQSVPESFTFTPDGRHLYGSSYYTGVSNIFRYEVATGAIEAVSNAETGYFRPVPLADGRLLVLGYTGAGFVPATIEPKVLKDVGAIRFLGAEVAARHPVVATWQVPPASTVDEEKLITKRGDFEPLAMLEFKNAYPVLQGYKNAVGLGYRVNIEDPLPFARIAITAAWTPDTELKREERGHLDVTYEYLGWRAQASWNRSDFYDIFGPTIRSRKGYALKLGRDETLIYDEPRRLDLKLDVAAYTKIDALPDYQNVGATFDRLLTAQARLYYTHMQRSIGAVDDEQGMTWELVASANHANGDTVPQVRGGLDLGMALPLPNSSIWLRSAAGTSRGKSEDPFANFYFGGFGNNYIDNRAIKRYREYYALPGFELNEVAGRSFARATVEVNAPPVILDAVGTPSLHAVFLRPSAFATALWTDPNHADSRKRYASIGAQVDLRFNVLHWYEMTLSAGYGVGYRGSKRAGDEWMISLKIL